MFKKILTFIILLSLIFSFIFIPSSKSSDEPPFIPQGWVRPSEKPDKLFYQKRIINYNNLTYYAYALENYNLPYHAWIIFDKNNKVVTDKQIFKEVSCIAESSYLFDKLKKIEEDKKMMTDSIEVYNKILIGAWAYLCGETVVKLGSKALGAIGSILTSGGFSTTVGTLSSQSLKSIPYIINEVIIKLIGLESTKSFILKWFGINIMTSKTKIFSITKISLFVYHLKILSEAKKSLNRLMDMFKQNKTIQTIEEAEQFLYDYYLFRISPHSIPAIEQLMDVKNWKDTFLLIGDNLVGGYIGATVSELKDVLDYILSLIVGNNAIDNPIKRAVDSYNESVEEDIDVCNIINHAFEVDNINTTAYKLYKDLTTKDKEKKEMADLLILTNPDKAKVYLDDIYMGESNISLQVSIGEHKLKITKEGYEDYSKTIKVEKDKDNTININLIQKPTKGTLSLSSTPPEANVYINNSYKGKTPINLSLDPGTYTLKLTKEGYEDYIKTINIEKDKKLEINAELKIKEETKEGTLLFKYKIGFFKCFEIYNNKIFCLVTIGIDHYFICIDAFNGETIWKYKLGTLNSDGFLRYDNKIYCFSQYLYCLNESTGDLIWSYKMSDDHIYYLCNIYDNKIYINSSDGYLYCFDALKGNLIWKYKTFEGNLISTSKPIIHNNKLYFGTSDNYFNCIDILSGKLIWRYKGNDIFYTPTLYNNRIYVGSYDQFLYCFDALKGDVIWKFKVFNDYFIPINICNDKIFVGSNDTYLYCLDALNGNLIWKYKTEDGIENVGTILDNRIYFASWDGFLYCIDIQDGSLLWKFKTEKEVFSSPVIHNEKIYLTSTDSYLYCIDISKGNLIWKFKTEKDIYLTPIIYDNKIYFASNDYYLYCIYIGE